MSKAVLLFYRMFAAATLGLVASAASDRSVEFEVPVCEIDATPIYITKWLLVGEFMPAAGQDLWKTDFLEGVEQKETDPQCCWRTPLVIRESGREPKIQVVQGSPSLDLQLAFGRSYDPEAVPSAAYCVCSLLARGDVNVFLLLGSAESEKVWLNGERLPTYEEKHGLTTFHDLVRLHLHEGRNTLLVKVVRWRSATWGLVAKVAVTPEAAADAALAGQQLLEPVLLKRPVIKAGEPLPFAPQAVPDECTFSAEIRDFEGRSLVKTSVSARGRNWAPAQDWEEGVYLLKVSCERQDYTEPFYVGNLEAGVAKALEAILQAQGSNATDADLDTFRRRLQFLRDANLKYPSRDTASKIVSVLRDLACTLQRMKAGRGALAGAPGLHLRGFRSELDGSVQNYRIYYPGESANRPVPLLAIMPTQTSAEREFIASPFVAARVEAERLSLLAGRQGFAVLWCGYRSQPTGAPSDLAHIDEVLKNVQRDYPIDAARVYLSGACAGAVLAVRAAEKWPERFAGIALLNPVFRMGYYPTTFEREAFGGSREYADWRKKHTSFARFLQTTRLSTFLVQEAPEKGHGETADSDDFIREAKKAEAPVYIERLSSSHEHRLGAWSRILEWCGTQSPSSGPRQLLGDTAAGAEEPLCAFEDIFATPFVLVEGTHGSAEMQKAIRAVGDDIAAEWLAAHHAACRRMSDDQFLAQEEQGLSPILVGDSASNRAWDHVALGLPMEVSSDSIRLGTRTWKNTDLCFHAAFRTPTKAWPMAAFIGGPALPSIRLGPLKLFSNGWFSYAIWSGGKSPAQLIDAGS